MLERFIKYLSTEKRLSTHTLESYQNDLKQFEKHLNTVFEIYALEQADHVHLRSWIVSLSEARLSASSINRKIATLKSFYKFLLYREVIERNPTLRIKPLKQEKRLPEFVKEEEITTLLDHVEFSNDFEGLRDKLIIELLYASGIRLSELITLKHSDVNFHEKTIKVLGKRNKERIIPVHHSLILLIGSYETLKANEGLRNEFLLVTTKDKKLYPMFIYRKIKSYLSLVTTASKKSPHIIRHTFATHLLDKGADLNAVKDLLGHSSLAATQVYTHNSIEKLKSAFDQAHPKA